jgi:hypothetical protein
VQDRIKLFESFGFECIGGEIAAGIFDVNVTDLPEANLYIYVDFKKHRAFLDCGDCSEPFFLKGSFTKKEQQEYDDYEENSEQEIIDGQDISS